MLLMDITQLDLWTVTTLTEFLVSAIINIILYFLLQKGKERVW